MRVCASTRKKNMEAGNKRAKNVFASAFPSDEELRYLEETFQWEQLAKRYNDRTAEKAIEAARARGDQGDVGVPKDVFRLFLLRVNTPQLLDIASKSSLVADLIARPQFWFEKLQVDFPEVLRPMGVPRGYGYLRDATGQIVTRTMMDAFQEYMAPYVTPKWRNLYMVMRFWFTRLRRYVLKEKKLILSHGDVVISYDYTASGGARASVEYLFDASLNRTIPGSRSFGEAFTDVYGEKDWTRYLDIFLQRDMSEMESSVMGFNSMLTLMLEGSIWFQHELFKDDKKRPFLFSDAIRQGYILERDGKPMIGACAHCDEAPARVYAGCCRQVEYCSAECAQANWLEHRKVCAERNKNIS